jgi:hypothetical protein
MAEATGGYHPALIMLSSQVVSAKPLSPSGAGLTDFNDFSPGYPLLRGI